MVLQQCFARSDWGHQSRFQSRRMGDSRLRVWSGILEGCSNGSRPRRPRRGTGRRRSPLERVDRGRRNGDGGWQSTRRMTRQTRLRRARGGSRKGWIEVVVVVVVVVIAMAAVRRRQRRVEHPRFSQTTEKKAGGGI